ncbi:hypothetical protein [Streptomyces sp. NBC_00102]|uniref:hypothetical protein n=1 Tax=Streptomyces sp. NBC_00102 TaxID=2975652 RepID=UPI00224F2B64|nr:hypothetical protein [Streptomyces sp. NBC_00102]MCX5401582.1 hypothetical protein [Streptomyces sp. NBC_00102]
MMEETRTSPQNEPPSATPSPQQTMHEAREAIARFEAYARIRGARNSIFQASRVSPHEEQGAFDDLERAIIRLRRALG